MPNPKPSALSSGIGRPAPLTLPCHTPIIPAPLYITVVDDLHHPLATADVAGRFTLILRRGTRIPGVWEELVTQVPIGALYTWAVFGGVNPFNWVSSSREMYEYVTQPAEPYLIPPQLRLPRQRKGEPFRHRTLVLPRAHLPVAC